MAIVTAPGAEALTWAMEMGRGARRRGPRLRRYPRRRGHRCHPVHYRHLALVGSSGSSLADYRRALDPAAAGLVDLGRLPADWVELAGALAALLATGPGRPLKTLVDIGHLHRRD